MSVGLHEISIDASLPVSRKRFKEQLFYEPGLNFVVEKIAHVKLYTIDLFSWGGGGVEQQRKNPQVACLSSPERLLAYNPHSICF